MLTTITKGRSFAKILENIFEILKIITEIY